MWQATTTQRRLALVALGTAAAVTVVAAARRLLRTLHHRSNQPVVSELWVYPVKSCRGIPVQEARLTDTGFEYDREWFAAKASDGIPLKMSVVGKLAIISTVIDHRAAALVLSAPGHGSIHIPLHRDATATATDFDLWGMHGGSIDEGDAAAAWIAGATGVEDLRLRRVVRARDAKANPDMPVFPSQPAPMLAQDESPLMIMSEATAKQVSEACGDPAVDVRRFRPNIVIGGVAARAEDSYSTIQIADATIMTGRLCTRCSVPCVRPDGSMHSTFEPRKTLRKRWCVITGMDAAPRPVCGLSAFHTSGSGTVIRVGQPISVLETTPRPPQYIAAD